MNLNVPTICHGNKTKLNICFSFQALANILLNSIITILVLYSGL